jgi:transposase
MNRDSRRYRGKRRIQVSASRCARRSNGLSGCHQAQPTAATLLQAACVRPQTRNLALVAVMRKLLTTLNAIVRDNKPWAHAQN